MVATTLPIARDAINVLMESWPRAIDYTAVLGRLLAVPGVRHVHDLRVWTLTTGRYTLSVHLAIGELIFKIFFFLFHLLNREQLQHSQLNL